MSKNIISALNAVMNKVSYIQKTGKNSFHGYKYASEADLLDKLRPAMIEAGLVLIPSLKNYTVTDDHGNTTVMVEYTLAHTSGEIWPEKIVAVGCGNDRAKNGAIGDKGIYKALTGANKYLLFKLFQIETGDDPERDDQPAPIVPTKQELPAKLPEPDLSDVTVEEVEAYMKLALFAINDYGSNLDELKSWWREESENRKKYGIVDGTQEYNQLQNALKAKAAASKGKKK